MFKNKGDFIFTGGSFDLNCVDNDFINCLYEQFFENDLFSSSVEESNIQPIKKRNFKLRGGSLKKTINNKVYAESTDKVSLYPLSALSTAHKPCNVNKKTRSPKK